MNATATMNDLYQKPLPFHPQGLVETQCIALPQGAGKAIWALADRMRGFEIEIPITSTSDHRFLQRTNDLVQAFWSHFPKSDWTRLGIPPTAMVGPTTLLPLRILTATLGPELACGLLTRAGIQPKLAGSVVAEVAAIPRWGERMVAVRKRREWDDREEIPTTLSQETTLLDQMPMAGIADHLRTVAGFDRTWVAMPSEFTGYLWGVSVAFEEGLPEESVGQIRWARDLRSEAEVVLKPDGSDPERVLGALLSAWLLMKGGELDANEWTLLKTDLEDVNLQGTSADLLEASDWVVLHPFRLVAELRRVSSGGYEERATLIAVDLALPRDLVLRGARRLHEAILRYPLEF